MALSASQLMIVKLRPKLSLLGQLLQNAKRSTSCNKAAQSATEKHFCTRLTNVTPDL